MGKHFWTRQIHEKSEHKQPGCMWGLANVLAYHHWNSNVRKMIDNQKYENEDNSKCDGNPRTKLSPYGSYDEVEQLLDESQNPPVAEQSTKGPLRTKKRSLRARIKAMIADDSSKKSEKKQQKKGSSLRRTYSIHHLESLDGSFRKIVRNWKNPIIFFPQDIDNSADKTQKMENSHPCDWKDVTETDSKEKPDVLEIFKVDKDLFVKQLNETVLNWNNKPLLSKSRSFPLAGLSQGRKFKPMKLENKQKEVWSVPKQLGERKIEGFEDTVDDKKEEETGRGRVQAEHRVVRRIHRRSSSLNESLDKYARLFESSYPTDDKLHNSKSLKLNNENGHAPVYFRRIQSVSNVESYFSDLNLGITDEDRIFGLQDSKGEEKLVIILGNDRENVSFGGKTGPIDEPYALQIVDDDGSSDSENIKRLKEGTDKLDTSDSCQYLDTNTEDIILMDDQDQNCVSASNTCLHDGASHVEELQPSEDSKHQKSLESEPLQTTQNLHTRKNSTKIVELFRQDGCPNKNISDLNYVRHLLDESGISEDALERTWHASDQPLGPQLFEELEACWPHERDELNGWPDFYGCWHHQMLFHLVNEVLLEVYDLSLPYYPKALSFSCRVHPFPLGNHILEGISSTIGTLIDLNVEENQSLDGIVSYDLTNDHRWMNLQQESECTALELEDMIFDELLEEAMCN